MQNHPNDSAQDRIRAILGSSFTPGGETIRDRLRRHEREARAAAAGYSIKVPDRFEVRP